MGCHNREMNLPLRRWLPLWRLVCLHFSRVRRLSCDEDEEWMEAERSSESLSPYFLTSMDLSVQWRDAAAYNRLWIKFLSGISSGFVCRPERRADKRPTARDGRSIPQSVVKLGASLENWIVSFAHPGAQGDYSRKREVTPEAFLSQKFFLEHTARCVPPCSARRTLLKVHPSMHSLALIGL